MFCYRFLTGFGVRKHFSPDPQVIFCEPWLIQVQFLMHFLLQTLASSDTFRILLEMCVLKLNTEIGNETLRSAAVLFFFPPCWLLAMLYLSSECLCCREAQMSFWCLFLLEYILCALGHSVQAPWKVQSNTLRIIMLFYSEKVWLVSLQCRSLYVNGCWVLVS